MLVRLQRHEVELLATRALVRGQYALLDKSAETAKAAIESFQNYYESMFPFLERAAATVDQDKMRLQQHVQSVMEIDMSHIRRSRAADAKARGLRKFKIGGSQ